MYKLRPNFRSSPVFFFIVFNLCLSRPYGPTGIIYWALYFIIIIKSGNNTVKNLTLFFRTIALLNRLLNVFAVGWRGRFG